MGQRDGFSEGDFCWVDLSSKDLDEAKAFYSGLFGWTAQAGDTSGGPPYAMFLKDGKMVAGLGQLSEEMQAAGVPPSWNTYVQADDVDAVLQRVEANGGQVTVPAMDAAEFGRMAFITDATGASLGLWQPGSHHGCQVVNETGAWVWAELNTWEPDKATTFFHNTLGWEVTAVPEMGGYRMIKANDRPAGGILQMDEKHKGMPPSWSTYFQVDDVDATAKRVTELGGSVAVAPFDTGAGRMSVLADPHGAYFTVMHSERLDP